MICEIFLTLPLPFAYISSTGFSYTHNQSHVFLTWSRHTLTYPRIFTTSKGDLDLESLARDLDDLQYLLAQDNSSDEDEDLDLDLNLYSVFPTVTQVEVEATVVDLPPEQVRRVVDLRDYGLSAEIDIVNPGDLQHLLMR